MNKDFDVKTNQFAKIKQRNWKKVLKTQDTKAIDLVSKLLNFCPKIRLTPFQSLAHPYFDELRDFGQLKSLQSQMKINIPELFNFSNEEICRMTQQEMIQLIPDWYTIQCKMVKTEC